MKKYILLLVVILSCMYPTKAFGEEYIKTIDYRYDFVVYTQGKYWASGLPEWRTDREIEFDDSNTDSLLFTQTDNQSNYTTLTMTSVVSATDGTMFFRSSKVAGGLTTPWLSNFYADYIYKYSTSTVDVNYELSFTVSNNQGNRYNYIVVDIYGISRVDDSLVLKETYTFNNNPQTGQYGFGTSCTYEGNDGFNYKGFVYRLHLQCITSSTYAIKCDSSQYNLYTFTNSLDTFTESVDYTDQLNNINGSLQSIYNAIVSAPTTIVNAITSLPNTIITGIKNLFVYDDWQSDIEDIVEDVDVPYVNEITTVFTSILSTISTYNPYYREHVVLPNYITENPTNLIELDIDLSNILGGNAFGGYTWIELIRLGNNFAVFGLYYALIRKILLKIGIDINDYISPIIRRITNT